MITLEVIYTWEDGRQEVRYRRPFPSAGAWDLIAEVRTLRERAIQGRYESPYDYRFRKSENPKDRAAD